MFKKAKKILKKVIKFALSICTILGGIILVSVLPFDKIKQKFQKENEI